MGRIIIPRVYSIRRFFRNGLGLLAGTSNLPYRLSNRLWDWIYRRGNEQPASLLHQTPTSDISTLPPRPQPASVKKALSPRQQLQTVIRFDIWKTPYRNTLLVFLGFHLAQYLALPLFPLYQVRQLHLTDDQIGIGTALILPDSLARFNATQRSGTQFRASKQSPE